MPVIIGLSEAVRRMFLAAGWYPGRHVPVSSAVPADHPAAAILAEFGGLKAAPPDEDEGGEECARDDLDFRELWPDESITRVWAGILRTRLVGIADIHYAHGELYVADDGRCFGRSCVHDAFWFQGNSFGEAVEACLLGRRGRPMPRLDQASVYWFGVPVTRDDPALYVESVRGMK